MGHRTDYSPAQVWALCVQAYAEVCDENYETAELNAREATRLAQSKYDNLMAKMTLGSALIMGGRTEEGMNILEDVRQERNRRGLSQISFMYWPDIVYGTGLIALDQFEAGVDYLETAYQRFLKLGNWRAAGLAALTLGEVYLHGENNPTDPSEAMRFLREAVRLGESSSMNGLVACALIGLSALSASNNDPRDCIARAQALIAPLGSSALEQRLSEAVNRQGQHSD